MHFHDMLTLESDLASLDALLGKDFEVDAEDLTLAYTMGEKQREHTQNQYDRSVEMTVFWSYFINNLDSEGLSLEALYVKGALPALQSHQKSVNTNPGAAQAAEDWFNASLEGLRHSKELDAVNVIFSGCFDHFTGFTKDIYTDVPVPSVVKHHLNNGLTGLKSMYFFAVGKEY